MEIDKQVPKYLLTPGIDIHSTVAN